MDLKERIGILSRLGDYMLSGSEDWVLAKERACRENAWFLPEFIEIASRNIAQQYLNREKLEAWVKAYNLPGTNPSPKNIGIIMAGNIPLVGFHDFLSVFITGNIQTIKPSSKDSVLIRYLANELTRMAPAAANSIAFAERLKGCDAYIATGGNNSARYFEYYFGKYPHIIRRNRTSVAVLQGNETKEDLEKLADDIYLFFGLGCRNVTKIYVPEGYDFIPLLEACKKYNRFINESKYINNFDYQLAILLLNKKYYMSNGSLLVTENPQLFSPISCLHYEYYNNYAALVAELKNNPGVQCYVGGDGFAFGQAQSPELTDYADGVDTLQFLRNLEV